MIMEHHILQMNYYIHLDHRPGALAEFTRKIADAGINLNSFYIMHMEESTAEIAFTVDNVELICEMFEISNYN